MQRQYATKPIDRFAPIVRVVASSLLALSFVTFAILPGAASLNFTPSATLSTNGKIAVTTGQDPRVINLWDATTGKRLHSLPNSSANVSPNGKMYASLDWDADSIKVFDVASGKELRTLNGGGRPIAFSPDSTRLAGCHDGHQTIALWEIESGKVLLSVKSGFSSEIFSVACNGKIIAATNGYNIKLWDAASGKELRRLDDPSTLPDYYSIPRSVLRANKNVEWRAPVFSSVVFSPDGRTLASTTGDMTIRLWNVASRNELRTMVAHHADLRSVAFSPDGKMLAAVDSGHGEWTIKLWDVATGMPLRDFHLNDVSSVAFGPDSKTIIGAGAQPHEYLPKEFSINGKKCIRPELRFKLTIKEWDAQTGNELRMVQANMSEPQP